MAVPSSFRCDMQLAERAFSRAWAKTGKRIAARIAIMAITTRSSIRVKALEPRIRLVIRFLLPVRAFPIHRQPHLSPHRLQRIDRPAQTAVGVAAEVRPVDAGGVRLEDPFGDFLVGAAEMDRRF